MEAVERFDPTKGTKFGTYAVHWIRCKCSEVAAAERDVIYVPYEAAQRRAEVANAQSALKTALDRWALFAAQAILLPRRVILTHIPVGMSCCPAQGCSILSPATSGLGISARQGLVCGASIFCQIGHTHNYA